MFIIGSDGDFGYHTYGLGGGMAHKLLEDICKHFGLRVDWPQMVGKGVRMGRQHWSRLQELGKGCPTGRQSKVRRLFVRCVHIGELDG